MSSSTSPASDMATRTITHLSTRFLNRVQIHIHPSSSVPTTLLSSDTPTVDDLPVALVWTVESLRLLRSYGMAGSFTGTLAQFPQQNIFLGLPVQLLAEEVVFLVRRGCAVVVDECESYRFSTAEEREEVEKVVLEDRKSQQLEAWKERQQLRAKHSSHSSTQPPTAKELDTLPWHYTIPTTSSFPWYTPTTYTTLSSIQHIYTFPSTPTEIARTALFEHFLSHQGMWCMNGLRFGGTFAVYPGDPLRYHSHYTAQLVEEEEWMSLMSLVASGRLGTGVKKTHLVCCVDGVVEEGLREELKRMKLEGLGKKGEGGRKALDVIRSGKFDVALRGEKDPTRGKEGEREKQEETKFADFSIFSLAWSGFGT